MSSHAILSPVSSHSTSEVSDSAERLSSIRGQLRARRNLPLPTPIHSAPPSSSEEGGYHQAELFYLQKQIQSQTPMVIVLEDGEHVEGCIEWYDRLCLKIRGRAKTLVYKTAIKYMYKLGEQGNS
jgi:sRNA-binding regulator protein Hfq